MQQFQSCLKKAFLQTCNVLIWQFQTCILSQPGSPEANTVVWETLIWIHGNNSSEWYECWHLQSFHCDVISPGAAQFAASVLTAYCANSILLLEKTLYFTSEVVGRSCNWGVKWLSTEEHGFHAFSCFVLPSGILWVETPKQLDCVKGSTTFSVRYVQSGWAEEFMFSVDVV